MFTDRRRALVIIAAAFGRIAKGNWRGHTASAPSEDNAKPDLSQIGKNIYSEEGIPMFLGCEDTASQGTAAGALALHQTDLNLKISSAFGRYAREWSRLHPDARAKDAPKLLEFLASRDFKSGGLETSL